MSKILTDVVNLCRVNLVSLVLLTLFQTLQTLADIVQTLVEVVLKRRRLENPSIHRLGRRCGIKKTRPAALI